MIRLKRTAVTAALVGCLSLAAAGSASAATTIGQLFTPTGGCTGTYTYLQNSVASGNSYRTPAPGVITSWSFQNGATAVTGLKFKVARATNEGSEMIVGETVAGTQASGAQTTTPARISVQSNDIIGFSRTGGDCVDNTAGMNDVIEFNPSDVPPSSTSSPFNPSTETKLPVSATLEPDTDNDGFGDETQDKCPGVTGSIQGCPQADLSITKTASASGVFGGQNVTYTLTAKNNGPDPAPGVVVNDALPAGAAFVSATPSSGTCSGTLSCNVGTLASGASATVTVVVKMTTLGTKTDTATVDSAALDQAAKNASGAGDSNASNNSSSATTTVFAPAFVGASLKAGTLTVKNGGVTESVTSPSAGNGTLTLTDVINPANGKVISAKKHKHSHRRTITLGSASFTIAAGQTMNVRINLSQQALKLLKQDRTMKATLTAITTDLFGTKTKTKTKVTLKPAKVKKKHHKKH